MTSKKFALLLAIAFVLSCIPVVAGATMILPPTYSRVVAGVTKITGTSVDAMTLRATFPNGRTATVNVSGGGRPWSIPVSGVLKEGNVIRLDFTVDSSSWGYRLITVDPPDTGLGGATTSNTGNTTASGTGSDAGTTAGATDAAGSSTTPATGDARPLIYFASGLFIVGLALALLIRAAWLRQQA